MNKLIIAVDFDGTLVENEFPAIGNPIEETINTIKEIMRRGHDVILWTCREGEALEQAVEFCSNNGLEFTAINDNTEYIKKLFGGNSRKIFAHFYFDDCALFDLGCLVKEIRKVEGEINDFKRKNRLLQEDMRCVTGYNFSIRKTGDN
jgi:hypothetical protein